MTREEAIRLMAVYEAMTSSLAPILDGSKLSDKEEGKKITEAHCRLIMSIYEEGMRPIIRQYPDLDPDLGRGWVGEGLKK